MTVFRQIGYEAEAEVQGLLRRVRYQPNVGLTIECSYDDSLKVLNALSTGSTAGVSNLGGGRAADLRAKVLTAVQKDPQLLSAILQGAQAAGNAAAASPAPAPDQPTSAERARTAMPEVPGAPTGVRRSRQARPAATPPRKDSVAPGDQGEAPSDPAPAAAAADEPAQPTQPTASPPAAAAPAGNGQPPLAYNEETGQVIPLQGGAAPAESKTEPTADGGGLLPAVPEEVKGASHFVKVVKWVKDQGISERPQIVAACEQLRASVPLVKSIRNMDERVGRALALLDASPS